MDTRHEVFNQPKPFSGCNLFEGHQLVRDALKFNAPGPETAALSCLGAEPGTAGMQAHARLANAHTPERHTHDRFGRLLTRDVEPALLAGLLCRTSPGAVVHAFCDSRLAGHGGTLLAH